jgi:protein-disulfide isomerase
MIIARALWAGFLVSASLAAQTKPAPSKTATKAQPPAAAEGAKSALDKKTLEEYVRNLFLWMPPIQVNISDPKPSVLPEMVEVKVEATAGAARQEETFLISRDGKKMVRGVVLDIKENPFQDELNKLKTDLQPSLGTPGAPVVIVAFSDFQCQHCREEAKVLRQNLIAAYPNEVRLYFKDFPIEQIHPWAKTAAIAGRCIFRAKPAAFWDYHDWIFEVQADITPENLKPKILEHVQAKGLDAVQIGSCIDSRATEGEVNQSQLEARSLRVEATPTFFINGRRIQGSAPWPNLKAIIDWELARAKELGTGGEKCCELTLPSPLHK